MVHWGRQNGKGRNVRSYTAPAPNPEHPKSFPQPRILFTAMASHRKPESPSVSQSVQAFLSALTHREFQTTSLHNPHLQRLRLKPSLILTVIWAGWTSVQTLITSSFELQIWYARTDHCQELSPQYIHFLIWKNNAPLHQPKNKSHNNLQNNNHHLPRVY